MFKFRYLIFVLFRIKRTNATVYVPMWNTRVMIHTIPHWTILTTCKRLAQFVQRECCSRTKCECADHAYKRHFQPLAGNNIFSILPSVQVLFCGEKRSGGHISKASRDLRIAFATEQNLSCWYVAFRDYFQFFHSFHDISPRETLE